MSRVPLPDPEADLYWPYFEGAARGVLQIPRCEGCGRYVWIPAPACPHCRDGRLAWVPLSGRGTLFTWAVVERALHRPYAGLAPYVTGLVRPEEDARVRLVTRIVDVDPSGLQMEMPMEVVFRDLAFAGDDRRVPAPFFRPRGAA